VPAQTRKKAKRKIRANRIIALMLAVILLGSVLLAAALSNFYW
jgi:hypothetical protein